MKWKLAIEKDIDMDESTKKVLDRILSKGPPMATKSTPELTTIVDLMADIYEVLRATEINSVRIEGQDDYVDIFASHKNSAYEVRGKTKNCIHELINTVFEIPIDKETLSVMHLFFAVEYDAATDIDDEATPIVEVVKAPNGTIHKLNLRIVWSGLTASINLVATHKAYKLCKAIEPFVEFRPSTVSFNLDILKKLETTKITFANRDGTLTGRLQGSRAFVEVDIESNEKLRSHGKYDFGPFTYPFAEFISIIKPKYHIENIKGAISNEGVAEIAIETNHIDWRFIFQPMK